MSIATAVPLSEYLDTSYRPDCEYLDGELLERNVGEWDHSRLQMLLSTRRAFIYTKGSVREVKDGTLVTNDPDIRVVPGELD